MSSGSVIFVWAFKTRPLRHSFTHSLCEASFVLDLCVRL